MDIELKYKIVEKIIQSNDDTLLNEIKTKNRLLKEPVFLCNQKGCKNNFLAALSITKINLTNLDSVPITALFESLRLV